MSRKQKQRFTRAQKREMANKNHPEEICEVKNDKNSIIVDAQTDLSDIVPWVRPLPEFEGFDKYTPKGSKLTLKSKITKNSQGNAQIEYFMEGDELFHDIRGEVNAILS